MENFVKVLDDFLAKMESSFEPDPDDYQVDGIWYCGKCKTARQVAKEYNGRSVLLPCTCDCRKAEIEKAEARKAEEERKRLIKRMRTAGFPDEALVSLTFSMDDHENEKLSSAARKYVENFDEMRRRHKGLLLYGTVGTGKTFMACCIANALIDKGIPCMVTSFPRLVNTITGMRDGRQEYIDSLNKFVLLVIDDLASERDTEYMTEIVQQIIDARYRSGLPLIVTTNLTGDELKHPAEVRKQRIYSRLFEMCVPFEVVGDDRRRKKLIKENDELKELLGL